jgi:nucleotide-binding universal stress UspA family protein
MRVLLALDESTAAMDEALRLARERGAELTAVFVMDATWNEYLGSDWLSGSNSRGGFLEWVAQNEHDERLRAVAAFTDRAGDFPARVVNAAGRVSEEIVAEAGRGYDLLVMAAPFRRGLEVVRDAPGAVLAASPCSVLFVKNT